MLKHLLAGASALVLVASATAPAHAATTSAVNPLTAPWTGPYGGLPPFDKVKVSDFPSALDAAIAEARAETEAIANNSAPATFENTIVAMERTGETFNRVISMYGVYSGNLNSPDFQKIDQEYSPKISAFADYVAHNAKLFQRVAAVHDGAEMAKLTPEQKRLVEVDYVNFVQNGAKLSEADKAKAGKISERLASLYTTFSQNELYDEEHDVLIVDQASDLKGLTEAQVAAAASEAERRGQKGKWAFANTRSAIEPLLTYADNRALREKAFRMWTSRGDHPGAHDNNPVVTEILKLRAERSKLYGYPTYAHWHLANTMAKDPKNAMDLLTKAITPAIAQVKVDVASMQKLIDAEHGGFKLAAWDYRYYAEKQRKAQYDLDLNQLKPYLELNHVREAMFFAAGKLHGFTFKKIEGVAVFDPEMSVYEVRNRDNKVIGVWYFDPFARAGKNSGAWMNAYREQQKLTGPVITIVSNNANFIKSEPGKPVLLSWDDAKTMFHEFGHALHGLSSDVTYPGLSGTNTARDFVEFPSQFNENYFTTPEVLKFLVDKDGNPIPKALIDKINKASTFNQAFSVVEAEASAIVDMKLHLAGDTPIDPKAFEKRTLAEIGMPDEIVMRHRIPQFGHIFSGEGYAAGYYGYLWAEVLQHDAFEAFEEAGDPYDPATSKRFHDTILSVGNTVDPAVAFRNFRGRDASPDALLRSKGFLPAKTFPAKPADKK